MTQLLGFTRCSFTLLKPTTASLVFRTLTGTNRCLENSFLCLTYIAETLVVWRWNKLALATYYDTLYVSRLFDMRDSGGFHTFHSVLSVSVSMILADSVSIRDRAVRMSFPVNHFGSIIRIHSIIRIILFLVRALDTNLFCLSRSHSCSCTEVNTTAVTCSPHIIIMH